MKKFLILLMSLIITGGTSFASPSSFVGCAAPYDLSSGIGRTLANATGSNLIAQQVAQSLIKRQLKKESGEKFKVKVSSYSMADLKAGRFKSLDISGENLDLDGVFVSYLDFKTLCDFNYIVFDKNTNSMFFKEAFPMSYSIVMNENDLNKTMNSSGYAKLIRDVNGFGSALNLFKINDTHVKIHNNQFFYVFDYSLPFLGGHYNMIVEADLKVIDGNIEFKNTKIASKNFSIDISSLSKVLNYLNPLEFSLNILENNNTTMSVRNITLANNAINVNGTLIVDKNTVKEQK